MEILRKRYFKANKRDKSLILDKYCKNTGEERKYVIKRFNYIKVLHLLIELRHPTRRVALQKEKDILLSKYEKRIM